MSANKWMTVGLVVALGAFAQTANAQDKAVGFKVRGGFVNGISYLNDAHTADLQDRGWNAGAGISLELNKYVALRGDVDLNRNELSINDVASGRDVSRLFYDASLQVQYPLGDFTPYIFAGAGGVKLHAVGTSSDDAVRFAGTGGLGVTYTVPGTNLGLGIEGKSWLYTLKDMNGHMSGYDKLQYDATWNAAVSYRIPFGGAVKTASR